MIGIVLGSGLGNVAEKFEIRETIAFEQILGRELGGKVPPMGHHRRLLRADYKGKKIFALQGRLHFYEGFPMEAAVEPIRYLAGQGVKTLVLTFACGALNKKFKTRDFVALTDHLHLQSANPLRGSTEFLDCTEVYDAGLRKQLIRVARKLKLRVRPGVYASTDGPTYETPAEVRALARLGADVVGMSCTAEALVARSLGLSVLGLGWVSNMASGILPSAKLSHQEVLDLGRQVEAPFAKLVLSFLESL